MNTTAQRRSALVAGLVLLSLLVFLIGIAPSPAQTGAPTGSGGGAAVATPVTPALAAATQVKIAQIDRLAANSAAVIVPTRTVPSTSSTPTALWIVLAVGVALVLAVWLVGRRTGRTATAGSQAAYCRLHPEDMRCAAA